MVRDDNGRLTVREFIARHGDFPAIECLEDELDPAPAGEGYKRAGVVDKVREEVADWEKGGDDHVHEDQLENPWYYDQNTPQGSENVTSRHSSGSGVKQVEV